MGNGRLTSQVDAYELPGVPWTMAFHKDGYAMHGSYWHNNFGRRMSHGCINMRNEDALWLFRWSDPPFETSDWYTTGLGTLVQVI
jgi:lipoprotein-anchoring transpeptidase ErfK/SrfK